MHKSGSKIEKILFLNSHFSAYFLHCFETLCKISPKIEVLVITHKTNTEAPYIFKPHSKIKITNADSLPFSNLRSLCFNFEPDIIIISGWNYTKYLRLAYIFVKKEKLTILCLDNQWLATKKQIILSALTKPFFKMFFTHAWVSGIFQYQFASKLGFKRENILFHLYSANVDLFGNNFSITINNKKKSYPKIILFVGRLVPDKGIIDLLTAFSNIPQHIKHGWHIKIIGSGSMKECIRSRFRDTEISDFLQPTQLSIEMGHAGIFCLPSLRENWGVVIHEAAAAGLPILASDACGASNAFVKNGYNGLTFKHGNIYSLQEKLEEMMQFPVDKLLEMSIRSHELSTQITPDIWANSLLSIE